MKDLLMKERNDQNKQREFNRKADAFATHLFAAILGGVAAAIIYNI